MNVRQVDRVNRTPVMKTSSNNPLVHKSKTFITLFGFRAGSSFIKTQLKGQQQISKGVTLVRIKHLSVEHEMQLDIKV